MKIHLMHVYLNKWVNNLKRKPLFRNTVIERWERETAELEILCFYIGNVEFSEDIC